MFPEPPRQQVVLSQRFDHHRSAKAVTWRQLNRRELCDECIARQHETNGATLRSPARTIRLADDHVLRLYLCFTHAELWKAIDRGD